MNAISRRINDRESKEVKDTDKRILEFQRRLTIPVEVNYSEGLIDRTEYMDLMRGVSESVREYTRVLKLEADRYGSAK